MTPIVVYWTEYTATINGRVLKLVVCECCSTEYVYVLEREGVGSGTSFYFLNDEAAATNAEGGAEQILQEYLRNDFDPIPCPVCGHYQRYMFPKLYQTRSIWRPAAQLVCLVVGVLATVGGIVNALKHWQGPSDDTLYRMIGTWSAAALAAAGWGVLHAAHRAEQRRFDPNRDDLQARLTLGKSRALTRAEFELRRSADAK